MYAEKNICIVFDNQLTKKIDTRVSHNNEMLILADNEPRHGMGPF